MVERGGLENRCGCKPTQGSNPCLSATTSLISQINIEYQGMVCVSATMICSLPFARQILQDRAVGPVVPGAATDQMSQRIAHML